MSEQQEVARELAQVLTDRRATWSERLDKITGDRRRKHGPLDPDFA